MAFAIAYAQLEADGGHAGLLPRTVVVNDIAALRRLVESKRPFVLILSDATLANDLPSDNKHHVIVPFAEQHDVDLRLGRLDASEVARRLKDLGQSDRQSDQNGRLARRSLTALRRTLAVNRALHRPKWADAPVPREVRAMLLAGAWRDDSVGDREIVSQMAGVDYESLRDFATAVNAQADPFVSRVGDVWEVVALEDAWLLLVARQP